MRPSVAFDLKQSAVGEATSHFCAANPRVFGSVLHDTDQDGSDIDLLVDALPGTTLFDLGGLQEKLESLLGIHINLLTPADLPPKFRAKVLAEALPVLLRQLPAVQQNVEDEERNDDHSEDKSC
jgi:predicted nucleotidyltransferase